MSGEKIKSLVLQLPYLMDIQLIDQSSDVDMWSLVNDEGVDTTIQFISEKNEILISINSHIALDDLNIEKYQMLLKFNFLYRDTGGAHFAASTQDDSIHLQMSQPADIDASELSQIMSNLFILKDNWAELLRDQSKSEVDETMYSSSSIIRG
ncbi:CesT family type III secretion system chaperone [Algicola sagamiensis]|uniref:CesT family type III secretion system chaperone n=1 Tax=Algicola sagamiensis TaxID=163869 RepID=UPI00035D65A3|nr:CesT family type III secretion system chaperone [Algicola sagamiensis]